jgi:SAM-dependent methyltransferase
MDASMRQKVAMTTAFILGRGEAADMGMGSGAGSMALASLYPGLRVTGVDIDPDMVSLAQAKHRVPNLAFRVGDIARPLFPDRSLDAILNSSCIHHLTSFGGYRHDLALDAIRTQARQLREGGVLIIRDFLNPGSGDVLLDLPGEDGDESSDPTTCSTAALFERFGGEFRSLSAHPGFPWCPVEAAGLPQGWRRYRVDLRHATEFILRKDYRKDWALEAKEEYTHLTQAALDGAMEANGLRVLASQPIANPWIVQNRWKGQCAIRDLAGAALPFPATNHLAVGERVAPGQGVAIRERRLPEAPLGFIAIGRHLDRETGRVFDLVRRPGDAVDYVPHFTLDGNTYVVARMGYPRPIMTASDPSLDGTRNPAWVTGPLNLLRSDAPLGEAVENALLDDVRLEPEQILGMEAGCRYWPSPGGVLEEVRSVLIETVPIFAKTDLRDRSGFSTSGCVGAIEVGQALRAAQAGGFPDARLELNVYELCLRKGLSVGEWIGAPIRLSGTGAPGAEASPLAAILAAPPARRFVRPETVAGAGFMEARRSAFEEWAEDGSLVASVELEYTVPATLSTNSLSAAVMTTLGGVPCMGVLEDHLPAAQCLDGDSRVLVAPAWRIPKGVTTLDGALAFMADRIRADHGITLGPTWPLGGKHYPSPGVTPETAHPILAEVVTAAPSASPLRWVPLAELVAKRNDLPDGHLRIAIMRAAHALGLLD